MPRLSSLESVEKSVNVALRNIASVEKRWGGLSPEQRVRIVAALEQATQRLNDVNNRDNAFRLQD